MNLSQRILNLLFIYKEGTIDLDELTELQNWASSAPEHAALYQELLIDKKMPLDVEALPEQEARVLARIIAATPDLQEAAARAGALDTVRIRPLRFKVGFRIRLIAAACLMGALALAGGLIIYKNRSTSAVLVAAPVLKDNVLPGTNKAILTLADGSTVPVDNRADGAVADEQGATIRKQGDQLVYNAVTSTPLATVALNSLYVPRGGQYSLVLADGTKVWLNADSRLQFPVTFTGPTRNVTLQGEAYFEVSKDPHHPFHVESSHQSVVVLGTHFNVKAYEGDRETRTTLLEGAVRVVSDQGKAVTLAPNQATSFAKGLLSLTASANIDAVMAWQRGKFWYDDVELATIMQEIERSYDVTVNFQQEQLKTYKMNLVNVPRTITLKELLQFLTATGRVRCTIADRTVSISN